MNVPAIKDAGLSGDAGALLRQRDYAAALDALEGEAGRQEQPSADLCVKVARCLSALDRQREAVQWAVRVAERPEGFRNWIGAHGIAMKCDAVARLEGRRRLRLAVVGTWTTDQFVSLLELAALQRGLCLELYHADFDQYFADTLNSDSRLYAHEPEAILLCPDYRALGLPGFTDDPDGYAEAAVVRWTSVWGALKASAPGAIILQQLFATPAEGVFGAFGAGLPGARTTLTAEINRRIARHAAEAGIGLIDVDSLAAQWGKIAWFDDRNWHLAKMAVAPAAMPLLAQRTIASLLAQLGLSRRCLVMDLDNTLWGGVIGDDGLDGIVLGEGVSGEAFVDFQRYIKELKERGVVLAVCSKNDADVARQPFLMHPEMVLGLDDIAVFVANWQSKSDNLRAIAETLNLGIESLVFVDDNPYERAEVRRALPEVDVITLPEDVSGYRAAIMSYPFFEPSAFTDEDRQRGDQYQARHRAEALRESTGSLEDYQKSLGMVATIGPIDAVNTARVVQLINKTNQFNLTTRRRDRFELEAFLADPLGPGEPEPEKQLSPADWNARGPQPVVPQAPKVALVAHHAPPLQAAPGSEGHQHGGGEPGDRRRHHQRPGRHQGHEGAEPCDKRRPPLHGRAQHGLDRVSLHGYCSKPSRVISTG